MDGVQKQLEFVAVELRPSRKKQIIKIEGFKQQSLSRHISRWKQIEPYRLGVQQTAQRFSAL